MGICNDPNGYWAVDGVPIYTPTSVTIENDNIVSSDSGRTESGRMYINWIRPTVRKIKLVYKRISGLEVAFMHNLMQGKEFNFSYYDNGPQAMSAYCGRDSYTQKDLSAAYASVGGLYQDYTIDVIEM